MRLTLASLLRMAPLSALVLVAATQAQAQEQAMSQSQLDIFADMAAQIAELKSANDVLASKVGRLEEGALIAESGAQWLTEKRANEIRALVTDVLADANSRVSLQDSGATAGWNGSGSGFFIASPEGNFTLNVRGQIQVRWAFNQRSTDGITSSNQGTTTTVPRADTWGFENRRTRIMLFGCVMDPSWTYEVQLALNRTPGALSNGDQDFNSGNIVGGVENIWIQKDFDNGIALRVGQFKSPFLREELVSSATQLVVERSVVNEVFNTKFSQGLQLNLGGRAQDNLRAQLYYGGGMRANATLVPTNTAGNFAAPAGNYAGSYTTSFNANPTNYAFAGRVEYLGEGSWGQFSDLTSMRGQNFGWMLGIGGMAQSIRSNTTGAVAASTTDSMWGVTADLTLDFDGANLFAYGVFRRVNLAGEVDTRGGEQSDGMNQWGAVAQGGVFLTDNLELYARYELGNTDTDQFRTVAPGVTLELASVATVGCNYYFGGNNDVKWSNDIGYAFNPLGDFAANGASWLVDFSGDTNGGFTNEGQWVIRSQLQLLF